MANEVYVNRTMINLSASTVLLVQASLTELDILAQVFNGFGVKGMRKCLSGADARKAIAESEYDLMVVDSELPEESGFDFIHWLRRCDRAMNRLAPVILMSGYVRARDVARARDCGASYVLAKPITPKVMFDRVHWLARDNRLFVDCETYVGPDRRSKVFGPPAGMAGRRKDDLSADVGIASTPNLSQAQLDALFSPQEGRRMSDPKLFRHISGLSRNMRKPGGMTAEEAIANAEKKVEALRGKSLDAVDRAIAVIMSGAGAGAQPTADAAQEMFAAANSIIGVAGVFGLGPLGQAAHSLCALIDLYQDTGSWSMAAARVHCDSLRLLRDPDLAPEEASQVLAGLHRLVENQRRIAAVA